MSSILIARLPLKSLERQQIAPVNTGRFTIGPQSHVTTETGVKRQSLVQELPEKLPGSFLHSCYYPSP